MRELGRLFRTLCADKHTKWVTYVSKIEELLNMTQHQSTGYAPVELHFGESIKDKFQNVVSFPVAVGHAHDQIITMAKENLFANFEK